MVEASLHYNSLNGIQKCSFTYVFIIQNQNLTKVHLQEKIINFNKD